MPQLLKRMSVVYTKRMNSIPQFRSPPSSCLVLCFWGFVFAFKSSQFDKRYGFCKVLSEGRFRSFYAILQNNDFYNMKIKTYMNLKSYLLYVTLIQNCDKMTHKCDIISQINVKIIQMIYWYGFCSIDLQILKNLKNLT